MLQKKQKQNGAFSVKICDHENDFRTDKHFSFTNSNYLQYSLYMYQVWSKNSCLSELGSIGTQTLHPWPPTGEHKTWIKR